MRFTVNTDCGTSETVQNLLRAYLEHATPSCVVARLVMAFADYRQQRGEGGADDRENDTSEAISARLQLYRQELRSMEAAYVDGPIPMASSHRQTFDRQNAERKLAEARESYIREIRLAHEAANVADPNESDGKEFVYRLLRANAALAQSCVWAEVLGWQEAIVTAMSEIMALSERATSTANANDYKERWLAECRAHGETRRQLSGETK